VSRFGTNDTYAWKNFGRSVESASKEAKSYHYPGMFEAPDLKVLPDFRDWFTYNTLPKGALALGQIEKILSIGALSPPHGLALLVPPPPPDLPKLPEMPNRALMKEYESYLLPQHQALAQKLFSLQDAVSAKRSQQEREGAEIAAACKRGDAKAIRVLMATTLVRHPLPPVLVADADFGLDTAARVALCTIEVPDLARLPILNKRGDSWTAKWLPVGEAERKRSTERVLHSLCVRAAYLVAMSDPGDLFDTVSVNAHQKWFDPATGAPREGIIASLQAAKSEIKQLQPGHLEAKACFRHLAGIATPNLQNAAPVRPIFVMSTEDDRVVPNQDVDAGLEQETNLATMPWEDFEHLVRQLFEWMFTNDGIEVKVTRASRDRGVDAIMFDPDPVRGGKYVLQAKRYTRTVDVAAVRDLYGTVMNEGANRGILVTTASYGRDAYEFAKNKPISLIDGPNLIAMLRKHGRNYRVDIEEARRQEAD
jgi:restriction system protein